MRDHEDETTNERTTLPWEESEPSVVREGGVSYGGVYDLEERTAKFGEAVIEFLKTCALGAAHEPAGGSAHGLRHQRWGQLCRG